MLNQLENDTRVIDNWDKPTLKKWLQFYDNVKGTFFNLIDKISGKNTIKKYIWVEIYDSFSLPVIMACLKASEFKQAFQIWFDEYFGIGGLVANSLSTLNLINSS